MSNAIVIDLKLTGLGGLGSGIGQAQKMIGGLNKGANALAPSVAKAGKGLRSYTTQASKDYQQLIKLQQRGMMMNGQKGGMMGGLAGKMLGIASEAALIYTAVSLFRKAVEGAAEAAQRFNEAMYSAPGVSEKQAAQLDMSQRFSGLGPSDWAAIHEKIRNEGGIPYAELNRKYGYHPKQGAFGDLNPEPTAEAVIRYMRDPSVSQAQKDRMAYLTDPRLGKYSRMSEEEFRAQQKAGFGLNAENVANADSKESRFDAGVSRASSGIRPKAWIMDALETIGKGLDWIGQRTASGNLTAPPSIAQPTQASAEKLATALDRNTQAVRENSGVFKNGQGYGGGSRARNMPTAAFARQLMQDEHDRQAMQLGAYKL